MIGLYNTKCDLRKRLEAVFDICGLDKLEVEENHFPKIDGLFIDWKTSDNKLEFAHQAVMVENYLKKGIPTVIFDRKMALSFKEYNWLRKFNVTFFEPAIKHRVGFDFMPFWTEPLDSNWFPYLEYDREHEREIVLAYQGNLDDRIHSFEKYYSEYARLFPKKNIAFQTNPVNLRQKIDEWQNYNMKKLELIDFNLVGFTVLIGTKKEYEIGYLREDLFDIMRAGCVPILPEEHRFYGTVFDSIEDERELDYMLSLGHIRGVLIEEIHNNLLTYYPECHIKHTTETIRNLLI